MPLNLVDFFVRNCYIMVPMILHLIEIDLVVIVLSVGDKSKFIAIESTCFGTNL